MANVNTLRWQAIRHAADEYERYATQIERVKQEIEQVKQGLKDITEISFDKERVRARIEREHELVKGTKDPEKAVFERIIGRTDFQEACLLNRLVDYARTVGRILLPERGFGTGWLLEGDLLITNHHVLPNSSIAAESYINLGYERTLEGRPLNGEIFKLRPDIFFLTPRETPDGNIGDELDFTIVGVENKSQLGKALSEYGYVVLDGGKGKAIEGENCIVIQHPEGDYKKVVMRDIRLLAVENIPGADKHIYYESDTLPGASGSPVIALGTGEIIALHNAGVPRRDAQGRYLKKNGQVWQSNESEEEIDWIANQGVRVSKLIEAIQSFSLPSEAMDNKRNQLIQGMRYRQESVVRNSNVSNSIPTENTSNVTYSKLVKDKMPFVPQKAVAENTSSPKTAQNTYFIIRVSSLPVIRDHVINMIHQKFPNSKVKPLSPVEEETRLGAYLDVEIQGANDPWQTAAMLEVIDGVEEAEPDLPRYSTVGGSEDPASVREVTTLPFLTESFGRAGRPESEIWRRSPHMRGLDENTPEGLAQIRRWSHRAVNFSEDEILKQLGTRGLKELANLRLAQFDTGYSHHSKVKDGFNLKTDYDAIDEDDEAKDEESFGPFSRFRHYGHGTRTGSILMGVSDSEVDPTREGNIGLLRVIAEKKGTTLNITPFRIARSVVLIGRVKELITTATRAIASGYNVLTMSMGILPGSSALYDVARSAYERGVIWCCASGNVVKVVVAPGKYPGVICVAASNPDDAPWTGSCRGPEVDITAPGEYIYVPVLQDDDREDMSYGNGSSYATPHVAAAALLWLAKNAKELNEKYSQPWQRVEAFRYCLQVSARSVSKLPSNQFGPGILDIDKLLQTSLPDPADLRHAYFGTAGLEKAPGKRPLAVRELEYKDWELVMSRRMKETGDGMVSLKERFGGNGHEMATARSSNAQAFAKSLEVKAGIKSNGSLKESATTPATTAEAAYTRLLTLHEVQRQTKPSYLEEAEPVFKPEPV